MLKDGIDVVLKLPSFDVPSHTLPVCANEPCGPVIGAVAASNAVLWAILASCGGLKAGLESRNDGPSHPTEILHGNFFEDALMFRERQVWGSSTHGEEAVRALLKGIAAVDITEFPHRQGEMAQVSHEPGAFLQILE
jgi:hypothetical protein